MVVVSLPRSYEPTAFDKRRLDSLGVKLIFVPDGLSLGQSIIYVLNSIGNYSDRVSIIHGDTLFSHLSSELDICSVAKAEDAYDWASAGQHDDRVYSGFFSLSAQSLLIQKITECGYNFIRGVEEYAKVKTVSLVEMPDWMDFSLVNSYYRSISKLTTQRVFNSMEVSRYSVRKSSIDKLKIFHQ